MDIFIGQIWLLPYSFCPAGMVLCEGQLLPIAGNEPLHALLQNTYGGDGVKTFALPDLRGRTPVSEGQLPDGSYPLGMWAGTETTSLLESHLPAHSHPILGSPAPSNASTPNGNSLAATTGVPVYGTSDNLTPMAPGVIGTARVGEPHENRQPFMALRWAIAVHGIFPQ